LVSLVLRGLGIRPLRGRKLRGLRMMNAAIEGSYDVSTFAVAVDAEIERLNAQLDLFWSQELALYQRFGLRDGMRVLDCGCGPGYLLAKLHSVYPALQSVGIEVDDRLVSTAQRVVTEKKLINCRIWRQSITALEFPDNSFDFVVCRLVLEHLPDPMLALKEVLRVLKAGGSAVFVDNDFDFHERTHPDSDALDDLYAAYQRARRADGGNPCIGRELPLLMKKAGYACVDFHVVAAHNQVAGDLAFLRAEGAGIPVQLVKSGHLASDALDRIAGQWRSMLMSADHAIVRILLAAGGQKTAPDQAVDPDTSRVEVAAPPSPTIVKEHSADNRAGNGRLLILSRDSAAVNATALTNFIQATLARELKVPTDSLPMDEPMISIGVDSMAAVGLCAELETRLSVTLPMVDVLSGKTINDLTAQVLGLLK
jgi:ubiquinone/menaquinone biosynthesis C-methylase UbiE/acyl carrier protein